MTMAKEYIQNAVNRTPRPRSERLRKQGAVIVNSSVSVSGGSGGGGLDSHYHTNLEDLNQMRIIDGYMYLSESVADDEGNVTEELTKVRAGYADMALSNASGHTLDWFIPQSDGSLKLNPKYTGLYADGFMTGGGKGTSSGSGGGGLISTVYGADSFGGTFDRADNTSTFNAYAINSLYGAFTALRDDVERLSGQSAGTDAAWGTTSYGISPLTVDGTTKLVVLAEALDRYASRTWVEQTFLNSYTEQYRGTVTGIKVGTSEVYTPSDGTVSLPAYPTELKNPFALTFGAKTYDGSAARTITAADLGALTEHQSLEDYVTLSTRQTITGEKTFKESLKVGSGTLSWDETAKMFKFSHGVYSIGPMTAMGKMEAGKVVNGSTSEWYNIKLKARGKTSETGAVDHSIKSIATVVENYAKELADAKQYQFFLLQWRNGAWRAPAMSNSLRNAPLEKGMEKWSVGTTNVSSFWQGQKSFSALSIGTMLRQNGTWVFMNTRTTVKKVGCAIYKKTGVGSFGWQRVSNIAYVELRTRKNGQYSFAVRQD